MSSSNIRQLIDQLTAIDNKHSINEFARDGDGNPSNYYTSTVEFIESWRNSRIGQIEDMKDDGWSDEELREPLDNLSQEVKMFQQVANGFLKGGLKGGFTELGKLETFYIDYLGDHYTADNLDVNGDYTRVMGEHLGDWGYDGSRA
jgi:hypothetical protein